MKKLITGWKHIPGLHCGSAALRDISHYYGFPFSEEMCFGLGGGLGFYYSVSDNISPTHAIHVRGPGMEQQFFRNFGLDIEDWKYENDAEKAFETLKYFIDRDVPVLIQTDIFYLDYYNSSTHFPGHIIVVCGYDDENSQFYVSDTGFEENMTVSYENMKEARISQAMPYPLHNNWFEADLKNRSIDIPESAVRAIRNNSTGMLNGVETTRGVSGVERIKAWSEDLPCWEHIDDWKWSSRYAYQVISKRGTEGAAFRHMYRDFMKEVSDVIPALENHGLISRMDELGNLWMEISAIFKEISEMKTPGRHFQKASVKVIVLYEKEKSFYEKAIQLFD